MILKQLHKGNLPPNHLSLLICAFCFFLSVFLTRAQTSLNITDYGAVGDGIKFSVNTVSNSTVVTVSGTNTFSSADVGKVIEVFGAGPWVSYSNWGAVVTQQDIVCLITNVSADGTSLSLSIPCGWTMNAVCVVGTNNAPAFQAAINQASSLVSSGQYTNVTINIPAGTYLMMSSNVLNPNYVMNSISDTHPALTISSGGITFLGDCASNTILLGCGAGMEHLVAPGTPLTWISQGYAPYVPMRDTLIIFQGPVQNNQLPLVFENLTMDGGVQQGAQPYNYWELLQANGMGWDTTHHAIADNAGPYNSPGYLEMNQYKEFTNCVFAHWRGEICICWTSCATNCLTAWDDCVFEDGNATADNMYYGQRINHCLFNNVGKVMEYYQDNGYTNSSIMEDCIVTNISEVAGPGNVHVDCAITGATTNRTMPSFTFLNNQFYDDVGMESFSLNAAENVSFVSNSFSGSGPAINLTGTGQQPTDGTQVWYMTNILVVGNHFSCPGPLSIGYSEIADLYCSNNTGFSISASIGYATNIILSGNSGYNMGNDYYNIMSGPIRPGDPSKIISGQYMLDQTNNQWVLSTPYTIDGGSPFATNLISYGNGRRHELQGSGATFYLDDRQPGLIPAGAQLQISAQTWTGANCTNVYLSAAKPAQPFTITNGAPPITFYWNGTGWTNNITAAIGYSAIQFTANSTNGYTPMAVQFTCPSKDNAGNAVIGWNWNFGDGTTSPGQSPLHTYITPTNTTFSPTLIVTNINGVAESATGPQIAVGPPPLMVTPAVNGNLTLAWPGNAAGYTLQYTTNLTPPVVWMTVSSTPTPVNGQYAATSPVSGSQVFFRLMQSFALGSNVTINQPVLSYAVANGNIILSWPDSYTGFKLESTIGVTPVTWTTVQSAPVDVNGQFVVTNAISISPVEVFFRLANK
jgi:PKD domain